MRNITLAVDDEVLAVVRQYAAERQSSVNRLVRDYLGSIAVREDRAKRARGRIRELSRQSPARIGQKTWTRDDLHEGAT